MKVCVTCDKGLHRVGGYRNRTRATKFCPTGIRRSKPNLQWATLTTGGRIKICTSCKSKGKHLEVK